MAKRARITRRTALVGIASGLVSAPAFIGCQGKSQHSSGPIGEQRGPDVATIVKRFRSVPAIDGAGATVQRVFPTRHLRHLDPFVLLDDFNVSRPAGFPDHPHRGFEAFTYMMEGAFHHGDNLGNDSVVSAGGTQRFNSGAGARHSEMPGTDGENRGLQLWVNLPRRLKKMTPEYQEVQAGTLVELEADGTHQRLIAGPKSPAELQTHVDYRDVTLAAGKHFAQDVEGGWNTLLYVVDGSIDIDGEAVERGSGVIVSPGALDVAAPRGARFAFLSGKPHDEPIIHRGPFVD